MILVTGATGTIGREVIGLLAAADRPVAAVTRDPAAAALPADVQVVHGDASRPQTLASELDGVEAILLAPRAVGQATAELLALAAENGTKRVVMLSAVSVAYGGGYRRFAAAFQASEELVKGSGLEWTVLRCADFAANSLAWGPQIRAQGVVRGAYGESATAPVHERDVAEIAMKVLVEATHGGRTYALTGPHSLTQHEKVALIGQAVGERFAFMESPPEQVRQAMLAQGLPPDVPDRLLGYLATCLEQPGPVTSDVRELLGRPALSFRQWAADHAAAFCG
jgi:uncharacterized protein YbjT (DUF2867 family)